MEAQAFMGFLDYLGGEKGLLVLCLRDTKLKSLEFVYRILSLTSRGKKRNMFFSLSPSQNEGADSQETNPTWAKSYAED